MSLKHLSKEAGKFLAEKITSLEEAELYSYEQHIKSDGFYCPIDKMWMVSEMEHSGWVIPVTNRIVTTNQFHLTSEAWKMFSLEDVKRAMDQKMLEENEELGSW